MPETGEGPRCREERRGTVPWNQRALRQRTEDEDGAGKIGIRPF